MIKKIANIGTELKKEELKAINGGYGECNSTWGGDCIHSHNMCDYEWGGSPYYYSCLDSVGCSCYYDWLNK